MVIHELLEAASGNLCRRLQPGIDWLAHGFVLQPFCGGYGEREILAGRERDEHLTSRVSDGRLPTGITAVNYAGWV